MCLIELLWCEAERPGAWRFFFLPKLGPPNRCQLFEDVPQRKLACESCLIAGMMLP
jgi:hypothetical protein